MDHPLSALLTLFSAAAIAALAPAQTCSPILVGFQTGPQAIDANTPAQVVALLTLDEPGGPSLFAAGQFIIPPAIAGQRHFAARFRHGLWAPLHGGSLTSAARDLAHADLTPNGGPPASLFALTTSGLIHRWNGDAWDLASPGLSISQGYDLHAHADTAGPMLLAALGGGVYAWRGTGDWAPFGNLASQAALRFRTLDDGSGPALFVMGSFNDTSRNIRLLARLTDSQFEQFSLPPLLINRVSDIAWFDDGSGPALYATGEHTPATNQRAAFLMRLRNGVWEQVGGFDVRLAPGSLGPTLAVLDEGEGPRLYLAGHFTPQSSHPTGLIRWDGAAWSTTAHFIQSPTGSASTAPVDALARFDEDGPGPLPPATFIAGAFTAFNNTLNTLHATDAHAIAQYIGTPGNGRLESLSRGIGPALTPPFLTRFELSPVPFPAGPALFIGAPFTRAGGCYAQGGAALDQNAQWSLYPNRDDAGLIPPQSAALSFINNQPALLARFLNGSGSPIRRWNGVAWAAFAGSEVAPSSFSKLLTTTPDAAGPVFCVNQSQLLQLSGSSWVPAALFSGASAAMTADLGLGTRLLIACTYQGTSGVWAFDPEDPSSPAARIGPPVNGVQDIDILHPLQGVTLAISATGLPGRVAVLLNGEWEPLGDGITTSLGNPIEIAAFDDGDGEGLYAAGSFTSAGGVLCNGLARWRDGAWSAVAPEWPTSPTTQVRTTMAVLGNRLYIAGAFSHIGAVNADRLAYIERCPHRACSADFDGDGSPATDADIQAFFLCLAGTCCPRCTADFNNDGDTGTDADIEAFFRVLAGGPC
jgi:hypothetical protein